MNQMVTVEIWSYIASPFAAIGIVVLIWKIIRQPPTPPDNNMTDGDYYFMNEWSDGDG